jgi:cAMP-dependent protein kinase regulator
LLEIYRSFQVINGDNIKVASYDNKGSFGELALMYNAPRAATVSSVDGGTLWALDRQVI